MSWGFPARGCVRRSGKGGGSGFPGPRAPWVPFRRSVRSMPCRARITVCRRTAARSPSRMDGRPRWGRRAVPKRARPCRPAWRATPPGPATPTRPPRVGCGRARNAAISPTVASLTAVLLQRRGAHAEHVGPGVVPVGHEAAVEPARAAGDRGDSLGDPAAGAGLRGGQPQPAVGEGFAPPAREGVEFVIGRHGPNSQPLNQHRERQQGSRRRRGRRT